MGKITEMHGPSSDNSSVRLKNRLAASLKSRDYSDLLYRVNCGIKFARREWKKKEMRGRMYIYIYILNEDKMGAKEKNKT